ncbi:hypothetical protein GUITHDRAFT_121986 [Guillardia theta CCMP2712]|uniref:Uncharacterized protein n=1 Tax=Guillardia theta (strain CCMP2712) TaxID=905079 RepID=L1I6H5_GUITC|nr:hypothetical protein GUITHDRAFT_121986 [Guillardia theta CCMP2712]EKX31826.1 hypothetical protein GUITHDRAFT_121986 [Guillardia theta CCMP2712]|eukprot:XP_005818806.1 hypothetical protein GUITHDRAFT_121986 [Guillardia theta CCMP2712]
MHMNVTGHEYCIYTRTDIAGMCVEGGRSVMHFFLCSNNKGGFFRSPSHLPCFFLDNGVRQIKLPDIEATALARFSRFHGDRMEKYLSVALCFYGSAVNGEGERVFQSGRLGEASAEKIMFMLGSVMLKSTGYSMGNDVQGESLRVVSKLTTFLVRSRFFVDKLETVYATPMSDPLGLLRMCIMRIRSNQLGYALASFSSGSGDTVTAYDIVVLAMWKTLSGFMLMCEAGNFNDSYIVKEDAVMRVSAIARRVRVGMLAAALQCKPDDVAVRLLQLIRCAVNHAMYFLMNFVYTYIEDSAKKHDRFSVMLKLAPFMRVHRVDYVMMYGDSLNCMKTFYIHCLVDFVTIL